MYTQPAKVTLAAPGSPLHNVQQNRLNCTCAYRKSQMRDNWLLKTVGLLYTVRRAIEKREESMLRLAIETVGACRTASVGTTLPRWGTERGLIFRPRAARTGGEDRPLAVSRRRLPVPAGARAAAPACL